MVVFRTLLLRGYKLGIEVPNLSICKYKNSEHYNEKLAKKEDKIKVRLKGHKIKNPNGNGPPHYGKWGQLTPLKKIA